MALKKITSLILSLFTFSGCDAATAQRSKVNPEQAFSEPVQVALAVAAEAGDLGAIDRALKAGAKINEAGKSQMTALWFATLAKNERAFSHLLKLGADPNAPNETGEPLLGWSILNRDLRYFELALSHGGNPNALNTKINRPIIFQAISEDSNKALELLIKAGADINARDQNGSTPIVFASSARLMPKVLFLLKNGADPFLRNNTGADIASGIFSPNWAKDTESYKARQLVIELLEAKGLIFDWKIVDVANVGNLAEATGKEPVMWLTRSDKEPNPEWVRANPELAERWYQKWLRRPAPKLLGSPDREPR